MQNFYCKIGFIIYKKPIGYHVDGKSNKNWKNKGIKIDNYGISTQQTQWSFYWKNNNIQINVSKVNILH